MPNTKIVATLGPATDAPGVLRQLFAAGVDVFRLNASHGAQDDHAARIDAVRSAARESRVHAGILLDLQGPKIRLGRFEGGHATLETGATFTITTETGDGHCGARLHGLFALRPRRAAGRSHSAGRWLHRTRGARERRRQRAHARSQRRTHRRPQGHQPARRAGEHSLAHREGSGRPAFRTHRGRRYDRALLRAHRRRRAAVARPAGRAAHYRSSPRSRSPKAGTTSRAFST